MFGRLVMQWKWRLAMAGLASFAVLSLTILISAYSAQMRALESAAGWTPQVGAACEAEAAANAEQRLNACLVQASGDGYRQALCDYKDTSARSSAFSRCNPEVKTLPSYVADIASMPDALGAFSALATVIFISMTSVAMVRRERSTGVRRLSLLAAAISPFVIFMVLMLFWDEWNEGESYAAASVAGIVASPVIVILLLGGRRVIEWLRQGFAQDRQSGPVTQSSERAVLESAPAPRSPSLTAVAHAEKSAVKPAVSARPATVMPQSAPEAASQPVPKLKVRPLLVPDLKANYFVQHWRGHLSLPLSYWGNVFLLTFMFSFVSIGTSIDQSTMRAPALGASAGLLCIAFIFLASIWQMVGAWRSANNHVWRGGSGTWAGLAQAALIIGVLGTLGAVMTTTLPTTIELVKIATGDRGFAARQIRVLRNASMVEVTGGIGYGLTDELSKVLDAHPTVGTLHLNSNGGRVLEARKLRDMIAARGLRTYTSSECASACVLAFMGGTERLLSPTGKVGLHSFSIGGNSSPAAGYPSDYAFARAHHIDTALLEKGFAMPPSSMWYPTHRELLGANLVTRITGAD